MLRQITLLTVTDLIYFCYPESVGYYTDHPNHSVTRDAGALNNFNIHYVASGRGYVEIDGVQHELQSGQAVLYFPMQQQRYYSSKEDPWDIRWVHFYGNRLQDYMYELGLQRTNLWSLRQPGVWMEAHLALLAEAEENRMLHPSLLSTLTYGVIAAFIEQAVPLADTRSNKSTSRIHELLPMMQQEACKPFLLQDWADRAGVSSYYFCKLFRNELGMSPMDFITRSRLQAAKQWLLERPDANIGEIASEAGYANASYFNRKFMAHEGMTPTQYRGLFME